MDNNKVLKAGVGYTIANYLIKGLAFFTLPIFTRLLSTADFGIYNTFLAYENILTVILGVSFYSSFNAARFKFSKIERYISGCITFSAIVSLVILLFMQIAYPIYSRYLGLDRWLLVLLIVYSFSTAIITYYNSYVGLDYQYKKFILISAIGAIGNIVMSLLFVLTVFSNSRGVGRIVGMSIPTIFLSIYILIFFLSKNKPNLDKSYIKYALLYCIPIIPHSLSQIILNQFDRIMITSIVGESESGIYSFAYTMFSILLITITSIDKVWGPWFFDNLRENNYSKIKKKSTQYGLLMAVISSLLMLIAPEIIKFLGPKEYWDAIYCVIPIVIGGYFSFLYYIPCQVEYYYAKTKYIAVGSVVAAIINVILNFVFIQKYGYIAAAYTTLASYLLYFFFHYLISVHIAKKCLFETKKLVMMSCGVILFGVAAFELISFPIIRWILSFVIVIMYGIIVSREFGKTNKIKMIVKSIKKRKM